MTGNKELKNTITFLKAKSERLKRKAEKCPEGTSWWKEDFLNSAKECEELAKYLTVNFHKIEDDIRNKQ
jgi:hypothetical protein